MKEAEQKSIVIYKSWKKPLRRLSLEQKGRIFDALLDFPESPEFEDQMLVMAWDFMSEALESNAQKWGETREKRAAAGRKGAESTNGKRQQNTANPANADFAEQKQQSAANAAVSVNDNVKPCVRSCQHLPFLFRRRFRLLPGVPAGFHIAQRPHPVRLPAAQNAVYVPPRPVPALGSLVKRPTQDLRRKDLPPTLEPVQCTAGELANHLLKVLDKVGKVGICPGIGGCWGGGAALTTAMFCYVMLRIPMVVSWYTIGIQLVATWFPP